MLTGVVLARNEAANIVACLEALRPHVEELILIDMESTDGTVELARPLLDKVLSHPVVAEFDAVRNLAISEAKHDWLWFVDADERVSPHTGEVIRQLVRDHGHNFEAIVIPFKSYFCGQWMRHCGWWPGYTMPRVLKRGAFEFVGRLHGGVQVNGRQIRLAPDPAVAIDHFSYESVEHYLEKLNRYTSTEAAHLAESGNVWDWREALRDMVRDLWMYYEYNPGYLDKERGWILSWLSGQYRWLSRAKLIDHQQANPDQPLPFLGDAPRDLDEVIDLWRKELSALRAANPRLPLGLVWRSPVFDPSGYADEARAFIKGLAGGERPLRVEEIKWSDRACSLEHGDELLLRALCRAERPAHSAAITDCIPTLTQPDPHAALNVLRTTFETDRLPDGWLAELAKFDEVWVPSQQNYGAFRRSGFPPEQLRVVPSCYDESLYRPEGPQLRLPEQLSGRFVFLSVFDWQLRKGWDVLLRAYAQEFAADSGVGLFLKITRAHGHSLPMVRGQADQVLAEFGQSLIHRPEIVLSDQFLSASEMAALYRSTHAFVLPSRGEGWGRPYQEALACGLPVIGTRHLGSADFLSDDNSQLIDASLIAIPESAAREIPPYSGHRWYEPDVVGLRQAMRNLVDDPNHHRQIAVRAAQDMTERFGLAAGRQAITTALEQAEMRFAPVNLPHLASGQMRVVLEGELFANHSFANVNEQIALQLITDQRVGLSLKRVKNQPVYDESVPHAWKLRPYIDRNLDTVQVTIRHAFPPNWEPIRQGKWVHIQPWEFGHLPLDWIEPLKDRVDEAWVPSNYVKSVFERSGVPGEKVHVIPWGVNPEVYSPAAEPLLLPTDKAFRFLFVGGLIGRKGFDTLLEAYLAEFNSADDVCLVVKDLGSQTFYRYGNFREQLLSATQNAAGPEILYLQNAMTSGQLASLYTACQCFVAPYRAEGFGLPILEAMACGLAPITSEGGAADDFTSPDTAYLLSSHEVETTHDWPLAGPPLELSVSVEDVRRTMRLAYEDRQRTRRVGAAASRHVLERFTWQQTARRMIDRLLVLTARQPSVTSLLPPPQVSLPPDQSPVLAACLVARGAERQLGRALAQVMPFVDETIVVVAGQPDRSEAIAHEYGAKVVLAPDLNGDDSHHRVAPVATADWVFWIDPDDHLADTEIEHIRQVVLRQPAQVTEVLVDLPNSRLIGSNGHGGRLRVQRHARCVTAVVKSE